MLYVIEDREAEPVRARRVVHAAAGFFSLDDPEVMFIDPPFVCLTTKGFNHTLELARKARKGSSPVCEDA